MFSEMRGDVLHSPKGENWANTLPRGNWGRARAGLTRLLLGPTIV